MTNFHRNIDRRTMVGIAAGCVAAAAAGNAFAATYPSAPIKLVVPYAAGGGTDFFARLVGGKMEELIGQPIVIENKPGAGSNLGAQLVAKAEPNGYMILLGDMATFSVNQSLYETLPFDPEKDFSPIALTARFTFVLLANPRLVRGSSVAELVAMARSAPGAIRAAHAGAGSPLHLAAVMFEQTCDVKLNQIPYRGGGPAMQGMLGGDAHFMFVDYATARPHLEAGTLKALAVTAPSEQPVLPGVPPVAATPGLEGFEIWPWQGLAAPAGTPAPIIAKLHETYVRAIDDPEVRRRLAETGVEPLQSTVAEFNTHRRSEAVKWEKVIRAANIRLG
jgi:tripartite-type tricarboxylate transporter receptor subunit TctC